MGFSHSKRSRLGQSRALAAIVAAVCAIAMLMGGLVAAPKAWADQSGALRIEIDDAKSVGNWNISEKGQVVDLAVGQKVQLSVWNYMGSGLKTDFNNVDWYINDRAVNMASQDPNTGKWANRSDRDIDEFGAAISLSDNNGALTAMRTGTATLKAVMDEKGGKQETATAIFRVHTTKFKFVRVTDSHAIGDNEVTELTAGENMRMKYYPTFDGDGTTAKNKKFSYEFSTSLWNNPSNYSLQDKYGKETGDKVYAHGWDSTNFAAVDFGGPIQPTGDTVTVRGVIAGKSTVWVNAIFVIDHQKYVEISRGDKSVTKLVKFHEQLGDVTAKTTVNSVAPNFSVQYGSSTSPVAVHNGDSVDLSVGEKLQLNYSISPLHKAYATQTAAHWDSVEKSVATLDSDSSRTVTAVNAGTSTITASLGGTLFQFNAVVKEPKLTLTYQGKLAKPVDTTNRTMELTAGESADLTLGFATRHDYVSLSAMTWVSSNDSVASVKTSSAQSAAGKVPSTTVTAKKPGTVTVTGTIAGRTVKATVKVVDATLSIVRDTHQDTKDTSDDTQVTASGKTVELTPGENFKLYTKITPTHDYASFPASVTRTTWTEDSRGKTIDMKTNGDTATVYGISSRGQSSSKATVTAQAAGKSVTTTISVVRPQLKLTTTELDADHKQVTKDLTNQSFEFNRKATQRVTAAVSPLHADYATMDMKSVTWTSDKPSIAKVSSTTGETVTVTAVEVGSAKIQATLDGETATTTAKVVAKITGVENPKDVTTYEGKAPNLPQRVTVKWDNNTTSEEVVTWDKIDASKYKKAGNFSVNGTVKGYTGTVKVNVKVLGVRSNAPVTTVNTSTNVPPKLPATVKVTWSDGSQTTEAVTWDTPQFQQYAKAGTFNVNGYLKSSGTKVYATVNVAVTTQEMYRLYNPNSGEHFYTASTGERDGLKKLGWRDEGTGWIAPVKSNTPVYRLYNPNAGDHHYTTSVKERNDLKKAGWRDEGIGWYSAENAGKKPLYREYNPNAIAGAHNYTLSKAENDQLVKLGWRGEGYAWYAVS